MVLPEVRTQADPMRQTRLDLIKADFKNFLFVAWKHLGLPSPTPVQYEIADYLQHGGKRKIIEGFRGVGKSWVTSAYVCWRLLVDPQVKLLVVSASKSRADDFSTFTLQLIKEMPELKHLIPRRDQRESKIAFDVAPARAAHAPSVKSVGVYGQMTGSRAHEIIADDIEVAQNSLTQDMREKLLKTVMEFEAIIMPTVGKITYLGTPQTEESVYNKLREKGYECRIWPARIPDDQTLAGYQDALAPSISTKIDSVAVGTPTDPERFDETDLAEREASYGRSGFALQFMLDTRLSDALKYPLKCKDWIVANVAAADAPASIQYGSGLEQKLKDVKNPGFTGDRFYGPMYYDKENRRDYNLRVLTIDPAGRGKDETAWSIGMELNGNIWIPICDGSKSRFPNCESGYDEQVLTYIAKLAKQYKVHDIIIEDNFGDGMFEQLFKPILFKYHKCNVEGIRHTKQKELRIIDTLEPLLTQHRLIVDPSVIELDLATAKAGHLAHSLFYQMTRLTRERGALKHDDRLDSLSMLAAFMLTQLDVFDQDQEKAHQEQILQDELDIHVRLCRGEKYEDIVAEQQELGSPIKVR